MPSKVFRGVLYVASIVLAGVAWRLPWLHFAQETMIEMADRQRSIQ